MSVGFVPLNRSDILIHKPGGTPIPLKPAAPFIDMPDDQKAMPLDDGLKPKPLEPTFKDIYLQKREDLRKSADGMESILVRQVLKTMRSTIPEPEEDEDLFGSNSHATQMFTQMMDDNISDKVAANGDFGVGNHIFNSNINMLTQEFAEQLASGKTTPYGIRLKR